MASLSTAVDKVCFGCCRLSVRYSCCVQEDDKHDTLYIYFVRWSVPCHVTIYAVIWRVSDVNIIFAILVLLMQSRNTLNNVKRGRKEGKEEESRGENNEVKYKIYITGKMRKNLRFWNFSGNVLLFLLLKVSWRSFRAFGREDGKVKRSGLFEICRRWKVLRYYCICAVFAIEGRNFVNVGQNGIGLEILILILRGPHG